MTTVKTRLGDPGRASDMPFDPVDSISATDVQRAIREVADEASPLTTRGDIFIRDASGDARLPIGATARLLRSDGTDPSWAQAVLTTDVTGTLPVGNGGTGLATYAVGDLLYADGAASLAKLADVATGNALISGGVATAPSWGKIGLTTHVSGTLAAGNGGTGITSLGTGVATALGINVGSAGAFVTVNGALGTPSSGTLTNCTGLPSIVAANEASDTTCFLAFFTAATGELGPKTNAALAFNSSTGVLSLTSPNLTTPVLGTPASGTLTNCTGLVSIVAANEATDTTCFPAFFTAATGELGPKTNAGLTFNSNTGAFGAVSVNASTAATGYALGGVKTLYVSSSIYTAINDPDGTVKFFFGGTGDPNAYFGSNEYRFRAADNTTSLMILNSTSLTVDNGLWSNDPAAKIGYTTGAGGTQTQGTSKSTGVTLDKVCGQITMHNATLNAGTSVGFTLTNSAIATTDVVVVSIDSAASADSYFVGVDAVGAGSCRIHLRNITAGNLSEAVVLNFAVIKAVTS